MSFQSVHDLLTPTGVVRKQKFWDFFDGDSLRSWWTTNDVVGTNTFQMDDNKDGGFEIITGTGSGDKGTINFAGIDHYSKTGSVLIATVQTPDTTSRSLNWGFNNNSVGSFAFGSSIAWFSDDTNLTFLRLNSHDGSTTNGVDTTISSGTTTTYRTKMFAQSASIIGYVNGSLEAISTSNLPASDFEPAFQLLNRAGSAHEMHIRYCEAYNT